MIDSLLITSVHTAFLHCTDPRSSFHTWSAHSSPDHSPTNSGLDTPSPTLYTQEELDATYNNSYTNPGHTARANVHVNTTNTTNHRHHQFQAGLPRNHHNHIYSQRSLSLPNVSAQSSSASRTAVTPQSLSAAELEYPPSEHSSMSDSPTTIGCWGLVRRLAAPTVSSPPHHNPGDDHTDDDRQDETNKNSDRPPGQSLPHIMTDVGQIDLSKSTRNIIP